MKISSAQFLMSNTDPAKCPKPDRPEYAFIGRSNVGKSSLINMLMQRKDLAKTSGTPGKTQLINHFSINDSWYLVDLPGYGYAKVPKGHRSAFEKMISDYLLTRSNLINVFVLIDSRLPPQKIDLEFMEWLGESELPFSMVFTKLDKLKKTEWDRNIVAYNQKMLEAWYQLPVQFSTSSTSAEGREALLGYIDELNASLDLKFKG